MFSQIQYVKIPQSETLNAYTENKLDRLKEKYGMIQKLKVNYKLENKKPGKGKICEIECSIPGTKFHAAATSDYFETAAKVVFKLISKQLEKKKTMQMA